MAYSRDRDLLALEPRVFDEAAAAGQERLRLTDGVVAGTVLSSASGDFELAGVGAGSVVLIAGVAHEVLGRSSAHAVNVSLLRGDEDEQAIAGVQGTTLEVICRTFAPQAEAARRELEEMLELERLATEPATRATVVNLQAVRDLEVLGALRLIYRQALEANGQSTGVLEKARHYEHEFERACRRTEVTLDLDGDGVADRVVSVGAPRLVLL